ncbi:tetratricopeptide repeat protein [Tistrella mobilis]|uniref:nSTAND1 domain-containing NTPase n=2 Tax=Tistrella mobilis TaxID=171437 RepID=UPI0031F5FF96
MVRIFISHSNRDNDDATEIDARLKSAGFDNRFLDIDKHGGIQPGDDWERRLYHEVERAQAVVLIVTDNWLDSKWCFVEFTQARALGKAIFILILTATKEKIVGKDLQHIDLTAGRDVGLAWLVRRLTEITLQSRAHLDLPRGTVPFPGLPAFEETQAAVFFGRDAEILDLMERLRQIRTSGGARLITLLGASGSGKSSLLRAGLVARLRYDRDNWIVCKPFRPEAEPVDRLIDTLLLTLREAGPGESPGDGEAERRWREALASATPGEALREIARALRRRAGALDAQILIPIDQAEELFTRAEPSKQRAFFALLDAALADDLPFVAIAALRSDHLGDWQTVDGLSAPAVLHPLARMPLAHIGSLVRDPAKLVHLKVDEEMIAALTADAESDDALPLIAFLLRRMYDTIGTDTAWTLAHYQAMGDRRADRTPLQDAVRRAADDALPDLTDSQAAALREAFVSALVRVNAEGGFVRKAARLADIPHEARPLLQRLVEARLLVTDIRAGADGSGPSETVIEVAHEALFRVWPRLSGWLDEARDFLIGKARLNQMFQDWQKLETSERRKGLLSGIMLDRARGWLAAYPHRFSDAERAFIEESDRAEVEDQQKLLREAQRATDALAAATETADALIFNLAQKFRRSGLPNAMVREILEEARRLLDRLNTGDNRSAALERSRAVALAELGQSLAEFGAPDEARQLYEESLEIFQRLAEREPENTQAQRDLSLGLEKIADIRQRQDPAAALALYEQSLEIRRRLAEREPENTEAQRDLSISQEKIADIRQRQDPAAALALYEQSLEIRRRLAEREPENTQARRDLSVSLNNIADIRQRQDPAAALALYEQSLEITRRLAEREPENTQAQRDLSISLNNIADIRQRQDPAAALALYEQSLEITRRLAAWEPENTQAQRDLSISLDRIADIRQRQDPAAALALYEQSLEITRRLAEREPENTQAQRDLSVSLNKIADTRQWQDPAAALALYEQSLEIRRRLAAREPENTEAQRDLSLSLDSIADIRQRQDPATALALYEQSLEIRQRLAAREPENTEAQRDVSVSLNRIADIRQRQDPAAALALYEQSLEITQRLAEREPENTQAQRDLSVSLSRIADIRQQQDPAAALALYEQSLEIRRRLAKRKPENTQVQRDLSVSLEKIADIRQRQDPAAALALYEQSLEIRRRLAKREPENTQVQRDLSVSLEKIADIRQRQDPAAALALYEQSLEIFKRLAEREPENTQAQRDLSVSLDRIADIRQRQDPAAALALYEQSLEIATRLAQQSDSIEAKTDLVISHYKISTVTTGARRIASLQQALDIAQQLEAAGQLTVVQADWPDILRRALAEAEGSE